jgi:hypothetical protein
LKLKIIEGEPAGFVSRGTHRMNLADHGAVLIFREGADLDALAAALTDALNSLDARRG